MKLIYLIAGFYRRAGMERALAVKVNYLAAHGYEVVIATTEQKGRKPAFELDPSIRLVDFAIGYEDNNGGSFANKFINYPAKLMRHKKLLKAFLMQEKADIVISMFCNEASFLPSIKDGSHKLLEVHFSRFKRLQYSRKGIWAIADRLRSRIDLQTARKYERFIVLTKEDAQFWGHMPGLRVIPNPRTFKCDAPATLDARQVLAAGRYGHQKGFDRLVAAWRSIDTEGWTLRLAGDGDLGFCIDPGENIITGPTPDMREELMRSSIYALSSRYEGLPMVLLEAQAAGVPAVCFTCKCGPKDIITDGVDGRLIAEGDIAGLACAIKELMDNEDMRKKMGAAAFRNSDNFDIESIMPQWEKLFGELS